MGLFDAVPAKKSVATVRTMGFSRDGATVSTITQDPGVKLFDALAPGQETVLPSSLGSL
jgi:hypothetical protein